MADYVGKLADLTISWLKVIKSHAILSAFCLLVNNRSLRNSTPVRIVLLQYYESTAQKLSTYRQ